MDEISIYSAAPSVARLRRVPLVGEVVRAVHVTTRPEVVRRFLVLAVGEPCTELRRQESERILRAQPFLAEASVLAFPSDSGDGAVRIEVRTTDETSLIVGARIGADRPFLSGLQLGSSNIAGSGIVAAGRWNSDRVYRDAFGGRYVDYQLLGRPYILTLDGRRDPLGGAWHVDAAHPFLTDLQRVAWRARNGEDDDYIRFEPDDDLTHAVRVRRQFFDVGGIVRIGPPGRLSLFGVSFSGDHDRPSELPVLLTDSGLAVDTSHALIDRYRPHRIARVNALWGVRDIHFVRAQGFDALTAIQDVPIGFQLGTLFGRSLSVLGSKDDDIFMAAELYAGAGTPSAATRLQLRGEGRRSNDDNAWDGILVAGRLAQYVKGVSSSHTMVASVEYSGGWRQRIPFALTLGDNQGGVRGYRALTTPGGQRAVARLESRQFLGRPNGVGDLGAGAFVDVGRLWAGDVPFGQSTPVLGSFGVSLLGAVPPRSSRMWRLDVAIPFDPNGRRLIEVRIWSTDRSSFYWREPSDVERTRERTVPSSIFSWP